MAEMSSPRERKCSTEKDMTALSKGTKRICLPMEREGYDRLIADAGAFRQFLDLMIAQWPELFPQTIGQGYTLHDILPFSKKLPAIRMRRIKVTSLERPQGEVFTIAPSFVLPYMRGYTEEVEKALFLRGKFGVPYWGLTHAFGHNDMYWERMELSLGRNSLVGTTVKHADKLPSDVLADEKHTWLNGAKGYVATPVGNGCVLGAAVAWHADEQDLTQAYQQFKTEAQNVQAHYQPASVNLAGWAATHAAWRTLFPMITVILCFLHAFIKIREWCKHMAAHFTELCQRVWETYHAPTAAQFLQRCAALQDWATQTLPPRYGLDRGAQVVWAGARIRQSLCVAHGPSYQ